MIKNLITKIIKISPRLKKYFEKKSIPEYFFGNAEMIQLARIKSDILRERLKYKLLKLYSKIVNNFNFENIDNFFKNGQTMEKIAEINLIDIKMFSYQSTTFIKQQLL